MSSKNRYLSPSEPLMLAQGGIETTLEFKTDFPLREFSAFEAALSDEWKHLIADDLKAYLRMAARHNLPLLVDTPTWRASPNWFDKLGTPQNDRETVYSRTLADTNAVIAQVERELGKLSVTVQGVIGPMGDGYCVDEVPTVDYARSYHSPALSAWKNAGVPEIFAVTMTSSNEAAGIALEAAALGLPLSVAFVLTVHGKLPSGETLPDAISFVDGVVADKKPMCYLINCIHPKYIAPVLLKGVRSGATWVARVAGVRGNASEKSHDQLDASDSLDEGNPQEWARQMLALVDIDPHMRVLGGCCGTDICHINHIAELLKLRN